MTSDTAPEAPRTARVSVNKPTYNRAKFLGLGIECVLGQHYPNLERIGIDDGSAIAQPRLRPVSVSFTVLKFKPYARAPWQALMLLALLRK